MSENTEAFVNQLTVDTAATALVRILQKYKLPYSYASRIELVKKIAQYINLEKLDLEEFSKEVRLVEECGSKIIFLRRLLNTKLLADTDLLNKTLNEKLDRPRSKKLETIKNPSSPCVNYFYVDDDVVRIKFSETHIKVAFSVEKRDFKDTPHTNVIVFSVNRKNGQSVIYLDTPWTLHPYENTKGKYPKEAYINFHLNNFHKIFGEAHSINLVSNVKKLIQNNPPICHATFSSDTNSANTKARLSNANLMTDVSYQERINDIKNAIITDTFWLNFIATASGGKLLADTKVNVHAVDGRLSIPSEMLASEVDYVISSIRKI